MFDFWSCVHLWALQVLDPDVNPLDKGSSFPIPASAAQEETLQAHALLVASLNGRR